MSEVNAKEALLEKIRLHAEATQALVNEIGDHVNEIEQLGHLDNDESRDLSLQHNNAQPFRWVAIGNKDLQTGLMALRRAVEMPVGY